MALLEINRNPTPRQVRQFALLLLPAFCWLMAGLGIYRHAWWPWLALLAVAGICSMLVGVVRPAWMRALFVGWMLAVYPIGWVVSLILMGVIYFFVFTPIGLIMRAVGRDPLEQRFDPAAKTYWVRRESETDPARYFRQY